MLRLHHFLLLYTFFFIGCSAARLQKQGKIQDKNFNVEIPFRYEYDLILVDVAINSTTHTFLFDTGAGLNVIDSSIAHQIRSDNLKQLKVTGSNNNTLTMDYLTVPSIILGGVEVLGSVAIVGNLSHFTKFLGCADVKGIIGNNFMRKANVQIDYVNKVIRLADHNNLFTPSADAHEIKMHAGKVGNVKLKVRAGDVSWYATFDTGFSGKLKSNYSELLSNYSTAFSKGITGASIHQVNVGSLAEIIVDTAHVAGLPFFSQTITIDTSASNLIGNKFLKNFVLTILWGSDQLYLDPIKTIEPDTLNPFEISLYPDFLNNTIQVYKLYEAHSEYSEDIIGWTVNKIDNIDVTQFNPDEMCTYWNTFKRELRSKNQIQLEISNENEKRNITIRRISIDE